jgi:hypothetical protein
MVCVEKIGTMEGKGMRRDEDKDKEGRKMKKRKWNKRRLSKLKFDIMEEGDR